MLNRDEMESYSRQYYNEIFKYCLYKLNNKEDAEDATQDTFYTFSQKGHLLEHRHIKAWLYVVARYSVLRTYRNRTNAMERLAEFNEDMPELANKFHSMEQDIVDYYGEGYIAEAYSCLSKREREVLELYDDGTRKTAEVARILGIEPHNCSMRKKRAKDRMRELLTEMMFY